MLWGPCMRTREAWTKTAALKRRKTRTAAGEYGRAARNPSDSQLLVRLCTRKYYVRLQHDGLVFSVQSLHTVFTFVFFSLGHYS